MDAENTAVKQPEQTVAQPQEGEKQVDTQVSEKQDNTLNQDDVNRIVAERVAREKSKFEKKYSGVDLDLYNQLVEEKETQRQSDLKKRGQFEEMLKEQAEKFNGKIQQYENELTSIKVDGSLLNEASGQKAINPQQVVQLLKGQLKLNEAGVVDVLDQNGQVRYNEKGEPIAVSQLVNEFLTANPHFVTAGPSGSGTGQGVGKQDNLVDNDTRKLNMENPEHRARYKELMKAKGIRV
ncbi:MAG: hypothetical protein Unbinned3585contig1000_24 [Prokaryotic dsDNA virus sp.]|jgi:hypothetical protein|nr:MAG: hypothetical protein Unbinned3585contig1000_24 [Prokaryotic dsDNA virus sp.]|tara:strand:+ start:15771 stop:16481 length:711 start_codon:yes stop_codon:yes gene_type:complete